MNRVIFGSEIYYLPPGKVLDVSRLNYSGRGAAVISIPGRHSISQLAADVNAPPIVSTNNQGYRLAMDFLGPEYSYFADLYDQGIVMPASNIGKPLPQIPPLYPQNNNQQYIPTIMPFNTPNFQ